MARRKRRDSSCTHIIDVAPASPAVEDPRLVTTTSDLRSYVQFIARGTSAFIHVQVTPEENPITLEVPRIWTFAGFLGHTYILHIVLNEKGVISVERPWWASIGKTETRAAILLAMDRKNIASLKNASFLSASETVLLREITDPRAKLVALVVRVVNTQDKTPRQNNAHAE